MVLPEQRRDTQALLRKAGITVSPQQVGADSDAVQALVGEVAPYQAPVAQQVQKNRNARQRRASVVVAAPVRRIVMSPRKFGARPSINSAPSRDGSSVNLPAAQRPLIAIAGYRKDNARATVSAGCD